MQPNFILGQEWLIKVCESLQIDPALVGRVIVDASAGGLLKIYVLYYGTHEFLEFAPLAVSFGEIQIIGGPNVGGQS